MTNKQKEIKNNEAQTHMKQYEEENVLLEYTVFMRNMYIDLHKQAVKKYEKILNKMKTNVIYIMKRVIKCTKEYLNTWKNS